MLDIMYYKQELAALINGEAPLLDGSPYAVKGFVRCIQKVETNSLLVKFYDNDMKPYSSNEYDEIWAFDCFVLSFIQNKRNFINEKKR